VQSFPGSSRHLVKCSVDREKMTGSNPAQEED
ncbi:uncharacterized, partial [Tachysurus ichikawai]